MEKVVSYAQENEDIILYHMLRDVENVKWIDVGANDPINLSVTKFFSLKGGRGINIEPQKHYIKRFKKDRTNDINLAIGISNKKGKMKMYGRGVGASLDAELETVKGWGGYYVVPVETLSRVYKKYISTFKDIHFLKIDVEGWEKECIEGADFSQCRPWILCIEAEEPGTNAPRWKEWEQILLENGYIYVGTSIPNRYYVAKEHEELKSRFVGSNELKNYYEIEHYVIDMNIEKKLRNHDRISFALAHPIISLRVMLGKIKK